ncbi:MAG: AAA family ATPase, partial [Candidatus Saccharimonadales bacterium]
MSAEDRAAKARFARFFDAKWLRVILWILELISLIAWFWWALIDHQMVAHLLFGLSGSIAVLLFWYYGELMELEPAQAINNANDVRLVLERHLLARLKPNMTPAQLAKLVERQPGGYFFASRYGLGQDFLQTVCATSGDCNAVWQEALSLARTSQSKQVDSVVLVVALILSAHNPDQLLAPLELDSQDIVAGIGWYHHMEQMIERQKDNRHYGGIGRDFSFGWAPLLNRVAYNVTNDILSGGIVRRSVASRLPTLDQMVHLLSQPGRRNATIVGESGTGKTTLVHTLAQRLLLDPKSVPADLRYQQVMELNASRLISMAKGRGQLEELLIRVFNEAISAKNVIIFLDEAQLFLRDGTGSVDLSSLLLPVLEGGALKIVISLSDQEWLKLSQTNSGLAQLLNRVVVSPLD